MKIKVRRIKASATVEAAFIVPFAFFIMIAVMALIFMLYNRMKLTGDIGFLLERARESKQSSGSIDTEELEKCWHELSGKGYLFCRATEPAISINGNEVIIRADIEMDTPLGKMIGKPAGILGTMTVIDSTTITSRETTMRLIDAGKEIVNAD